jgi:hypothetical protein
MQSNHLYNLLVKFPDTSPEIYTIRDVLDDILHHKNTKHNENLNYHGAVLRQFIERRKTSHSSLATSAEIIKNEFANVYTSIVKNMEDKINFITNFRSFITNFILQPDGNLRHHMNNIIESLKDINYGLSYTLHSQIWYNARLKSNISQYYLDDCVYQAVKDHKSMNIVLSNL